MELEAAKQAAVRNQSPTKDTPRRARHRAIQFANKAMRAKLYAPKQTSLAHSAGGTRRRPLRDQPSRRPIGPTSRRPAPRHHPP